MKARIVLLALVLSGGCARLEEHVRHADEAYRASRYDDAEVWLEHIELDVGDLDRENQTEFYFVRGMSAYRLGRRDDALHFLSLARETNELDGNVYLQPTDAEALARALAELTPTSMTHHAAPAPETDEVAAPVDVRPN